MSKEYVFLSGGLFLKLQSMSSCANQFISVSQSNKTKSKKDSDDLKSNII